MRVLVVDDHHELGSIVRDGLSEHLIDAVVEHSFESGLARAARGAFQVIVLDVALPDGDGFEFCRQLRLSAIDTPVLMLTSLTTLDDRVRGLEAGADDYVTKPFSFLELLARIRALARRSPTPEDRTVHVADLEIELLSHRVRRAGRTLELTAYEFALLACLATHAGHVLSRTEITKNVWDQNHSPCDNVLDVLVRRVRRKVDDGYDVKLIHTTRGEGYRLGV